MTLRILMTADAVGGVWTYATELARALRPRANVLLAVMGPEPSAQQKAEAAEIEGLELRHRPWALEWTPNPWLDVEQSRDWLRELEEEFSPDLVHVNGYAYAAAGFRAPVLVVAHSCVASWWKAVHGTEAPREWDRYRSEVQRGIRSASRVVAPSAGMLHALRDAYDVKSDAAVIHNGLPAPPAAPAAAPRDEVILGAGRLWDEAKNAARLARVAGALEWPVRLAGESAGRELENVTMLGSLPRSAMWREMETAAIYVHPALYEPFGLAPLEAAQRGCALVLSDIETLRELWEGAAAFVNPRDEEAIASSVTSLIREPGERSRLARAAYERSRRYSAHAMAARYLQLYDDLIRSKPVVRNETLKERNRRHEDRAVLSLADL